MPSLNDILRVVFVVGIVIGGFYAYKWIFDFRLKRKSDDEESEKSKEEIKGPVLKDKLEKTAIVIFWIFSVAVAAVFIFAAIGQDVVVAGLALAYLGLVVYGAYNKIPTVHVGLPVSRILGRFWSTNDEQGFSKTIGKPASEGIIFTYPWRYYESFSRGTDDLEIPLRIYQTLQGSVLVRGVMSVRPTGLVVTRLSEMNENERKRLLMARVNKIMRTQILGKELAEALNMRESLEACIFDEMKAPAKVTEQNVDRVLFGRKVSFSENSFGLEVLSVALDDIDPTEEIQKRRDALVIEELKVKQRKIQLTADEMIKERYPDMSDNERMASLQILDGDIPTKRQINTIEIAESDKVLAVFKEVALGMIKRIGEKDKK